MSLSLPYVRMNGAGNDFVVVQTSDGAFRPTPEQARALCDRGADTGGCDQLIAIEPSDQGGDAFMRVWNADGGVVQTCGNALRCVGWLLTRSLGRDTARIDTLGGTAVARLISDGVQSEGVQGEGVQGGQVEVDMGRPRLDWDQIPLAEEMDTRGIELQVGPIDAPVLHTPGAVSMGNPHVVFFTDRLDDEFVRGSGSLVEHHPLFPEGVNVGFAHVLGRDRIRLRVWERGAGLTLACGTGACAAVVAAARRGLVDRDCRVTADGGELSIRWDPATDHVLMTGPIQVEGTGRLTF